MKGNHDQKGIYLGILHPKSHKAGDITEGIHRKLSHAYHRNPSIHLLGTHVSPTWIGIHCQPHLTLRAMYFE